MPEDLPDARDRTLLLLGYAGSLRRRELVASSLPGRQQRAILGQQTPQTGLLVLYLDPRRSADRCGVHDAIEELRLSQRSNQMGAKTDPPPRSGVTSSLDAMRIRRAVANGAWA